MPHLDRTAHLHELTADWGQTVSVLAYLGRACAVLGRSNTLAKIHQRGLQASVNTGCVDCRASTLTNIGVDFWCLERYAEAMAPLQDALAQLGTDEANTAQANLFLGLCNLKLGRPDEAIIHLKLASIGYRRNDKLAPQAIALSNLGIAHLSTAKPDVAAARTCFEHAAKLYQRLGDTDAHARVRRALATINEIGSRKGRRRQRN